MLQVARTLQTELYVFCKQSFMFSSILQNAQHKTDTLRNICKVTNNLDLE